MTERNSTTAAQERPPLLDPEVGAHRLLSKAEVLELVGVTYPTIWSWMRAGKFPRSREVGARTFWYASEIFAWLDALPVRPLKGDPVPSTDAARPQPVMKKSRHQR